MVTADRSTGARLAPCCDHRVDEHTPRWKGCKVVGCGCHSNRNSAAAQALRHADQTGAYLFASWKRFG